MTGILHAYPSSTPEVRCQPVSRGRRAEIRPDGDGAPVVIAKGYDEVAQKIKAIAAEHGIPMVENVTLARALAHEVQVGQPIKAKWFKPVAEILAAVYRLRKGAA